MHDLDLLNYHLTHLRVSYSTRSGCKEKSVCLRHTHLMCNLLSRVIPVTLQRMSPSKHIDLFHIICVLSSQLEWSPILISFTHTFHLHSYIEPFSAVFGEIFGHNWLRSECLQVQPVTC